jgi:Fur family ferric uptake transcriptional regulator
MTGRRDDVRRELSSAEGFRSAQDIYAGLRSTGSKIGLTTVYRALQVLSDSGEVDVLRTDDGEAVYRVCWADAVGAEHGFRDITHTVEVFGTCSKH